MRGTGAKVAAALVGVWVAGMTVVLTGLGWVVDQVLLYYGFARPWWLGPVTAAAVALLAGLPALLLAVLATVDRVRAVGRAWVAAAVVLGVLGTLRAVPPGDQEPYLALLALGAGGLAWLLPRLRRRRRERGDGTSAGAAPARPPVGPPAVLLGLLVGLVVLVPWWWLGALGGATETALAVLAAGAIGWLAAGLVRPPPAGHPLVAGLVAAVTLVLLAAGVGAGGTPLALLLVLPPLGLAAAALASRWATGLMVGVAAGGPLAFVDPVEITVLLAAPRDVPFWAAVAAAGSAVLGAAAGAGYLLARRRAGLRRARPGPDGPAPAGREWEGAAPAGRERPALPRTVTAVVTAAALLLTGAGHLALGQPGFHGDRLFVVLADQAELTGIPTGTGPAGRQARAREVHRRLVAHATASQADLRSALDRRGLAYTPYYLVNAVEVTGGRVVREWLARRPDVDRVLPSPRLRPVPAAGRPLAAGDRTPRNPEWNIAAIGADRVWRELGVTGEGILVGGADSGVDGSHPALAPGFRGGDDSWQDPWNGTTEPSDRNGHGTHTLGTAVGQGGIGVAPGAQWIACANLARNLGNPARYLDCLQFLFAPYPPGGDPWHDGRPARGAHVLTNSWTCPPVEGCDAAALRPATTALVAAGTYLVGAAGNAGPFCDTIQDPPARYPEVLTVGATDRDGGVAFFSSRGPAGGKPDLVAPGSRVVSAVPGGGYRALSGTSMAAPHVAGVVALLWSADPALVGDVPGTTRILRETARPVPVTAGEDSDCGGVTALAGAGMVDAYQAISGTANRR